MTRKMRLSDVAVGKNFEIWGHVYTVLDSDDKGIFVLETETVCEMPFREDEVDYKVAPNDFRDSSVRAYLEGDYLEELVKAGAELGRDILEMVLDLKCTLGQHEYEVARVHAGLLTLEQYGKYYDIIPRIDMTYWLATPWKTLNRSTSTVSTDLVWYVRTSGRCNFWGCSSACGVRPALTLSPSLLVSVSFTTREHVEKMWKGEWLHKKSLYDYKIFVCKRCGKQISIQGGPLIFCPACGAAQTDEAVQMVMKRLEALKDE